MKLKYTKSSLLAATVLLGLSAALPALADYPSTVLSQGPAGYWRLNETVAPPANVVAINQGSLSGANGTYQNFPTRGLTGPFAGSAGLGLDGVSQFVNIPWQAAINPNAFSVEIWANPAAVPNFAYLAASAVIASPRTGWYLAQDNNSTFGLGNGFVVRMFYNNAANPSVTLFATNDLPLGSWYHLVLTFDGTTATLYKNGAVAQSAAPLGYVANVSAPFSVGERSGTGFYWPGKVAEVATYTGALSAARVSAHYTAATSAPATYAATVGTDSPVIYWRFQETPDPIAANSGSLGAGANGSYAYNALPNQTGPNPSSSPTAFPGFEAANKSVLFDGASGAVRIPALNLNTNTVSITCWLNTTGGQQPSTGIFFNQGSAAVAGLQFDSTGGGTGLAYNWNSVPSTINWASGVSAVDGQWTYVALIVKPDQAILYVPGQTPATNFATHTVLAFNGLSYIGTEPGTGTLNGNVDEVAIFNRAISLGEAYSQYAAAKGGLAPQIFSQPAAPVNPLFTGDTLTLTVDAGGTPNLGYQWRKSTVAIPGATASTYAKANITGADNGTYDVVITNAFGSVTSSGASITVNTLTAPTISQPPVGRTLYQGGTLALTVVASGGALKYQWAKNGTPIAGATTSAYNVASVTTNDNGSYQVTVTNNLGSVIGGPVAINIPVLAAGTFAAVVAGDKPEAWYRLDDAGGPILYDAMGHHDGFWSNSSSGITFGTAGAISNGVAGTAPTFTGTADYGWVPFSPLLNTSDFTIECWALVPSVINNIVPVSSMDNPQAGYGFDTQSGNWYGFIGLNNVNYVVPTGATPQTAAIWPVVPNEWKHLVMVYSAATALRFYINGQWDGNAYVNFSRNPSAAFIIGALGQGASPITRNWQGKVDEVAVYTNAITLAQALAHYNAGIFLPGVAPVFSVQPQSQTVIEGSNATFTATVGGTTPLSFQWLKNGTPIAGRTNSSLTLSNVYYTDVANYQLRATNSAGANTSAVATLSVVPPPSFANATNGLVVHLKFDGTYADSSGRGNNGTARSSGGDVTTFVAGKVGASALHYVTHVDTPPHGTAVTGAGYVTIGTPGTPPTDLLFGSSQNFSVSYWVKLPVNYLDGDLPFLASAATSYGSFGLTLAPSYNAGGWSWFLGNASAGVGLYGPGASINNGAWHHLVHTFDRTGNGITYLDGVQVSSLPDATAGDIDSGSEFNIGQAPDGVYPEAGSADIDDVGIWRRVLTSYEAQSIYLVGNGGTSFDTYGPVSLSIRKAGSVLEIIWQAGTLQQADAITGPWTNVGGASAPYYTVAPSAAKKFYRVQL
jgi:hypothetical protein